MGRSITAQTLLEHAGFVRALARGLVADRETADDLAQETLLAGLDRPPPRAHNVRGWLRTVARNLARRRGRDERRRARHERRAEGRDWVEGAGERVARIELQRCAIEAVLALPEIYRDAIVARYLDELGPKEIAAREGLPLDTVRTRLRRGLALLRERLDDESGDRRTWMLALAPLVAQPAAAGALLGKTLAVVVLLVAAAVSVELASGRSSSPRADRAAPALREFEQAPEEIASTATEPASRTRGGDYRLRGNVAGARVVLRLRFYGGAADPEPLTAIADEDGFTGFDLPQREEPLFDAHAEIEAPGHLPLRLALAEPESAYTLEEATVLSGVVVDPEGRPLAGARVHHARTDDRGRFVVRAARQLAVARRGFLPRTVDAAKEAAPLTIRLERGLSVSGRVTTFDGSPAAGFWLDGGTDWAITDADGHYTLGGFVQGERVVVTCLLSAAGRPDGSTGSGGLRMSREAVAGATDADFTLPLGPTLRVAVVDERGRPFRHARVTAFFFARGFAPTRETATTGTTGIFLCPGTRREAQVTVTAPGYAVAEEKFLLDGRPIVDRRVVLVRARTKGTLALSGRPRRRLSVSLQTAGGVALPGPLPVELDERGEGRLDVVPGSFLVTLSPLPALDGYDLPATRDLSVAAGRTDPVDATLAEGGRILVRVLDATGAPLPPRGLLLLDERRRNTWTVFHQGAREARYRGDFRHSEDALSEALAPGRYLLRQTSDDQHVEREVVVERGRTTVVEIRR